MDTSTALALCIYVGPLAATCGLFVWVRSRRERRTQRLIREARNSGLDAPSSLHPHINPSRCLGCAVCVTACPEADVLGLVKNKAVLVNAANCVGHGACKDACPTGAITLVLGTREQGVEVPVLSPRFETNLPGLFVAGELGGMGLIRNAIQQGTQAIDSIVQLDGVAAPDQLDVVIVGAGPAGFAATLAAKEHGLRYLTLEQESLGGAIAHYPRRKLVLTAPLVLPMVGKIKIRETTKEALLELFEQTERETGVEIRYHEKVKAIEHGERGFVVHTATSTVATRAVVLAIGRRGSPRKLGAPGEDLPKVVYLLDDPASLKGLRVLVVGAGDSALEAAVSIANEPGTEVSLSCRGDSFARAKPQNRERISACEVEGRVRIFRKSTVKDISEGAVVLGMEDRIERLGNDAVIVCVGGELPFRFLREVGVETEMKYGEP